MLASARIYTCLLFVAVVNPFDSYLPINFYHSSLLTVYGAKIAIIIIS